VLNRINWSQISESDFNEVVEALLVRKHQQIQGERAYPLDGRGGDGGKDAVEFDGTIVHVYQLKFFPEGFSGGFRQTRRAQIKSSFDAAMESTSPREWTLVVPRNATDLELKFLTTLAGDRGVKIHYMGVAELNNLLASYPDLAQHFTREQLVDTLRSFGQEKAALTNSGDLPDRLRNLASLADARSQNWGINFGVKDGLVMQELYAKRPDAHLREPMTYSMNAAFTPDQDALRQEFQTAIDYGVLDSVSLPGTVISDFKYDGPEGFGPPIGDGTLESVQLQSMPLAVPPPALAVELRNTSAKSSLLGRTLRSARGSKGMTFESVFCECLRITWRLPAVEEQSKVMNTEFAFDVVNAPVSEALAALRFLRLMTAGAKMELWLSAKKLLHFDYRGTKFDWVADSDEQALFDFLEDLEYLESELDVRFSLSETPQVQDYVMARFSRMLLEGKCAMVPMFNSATAVVDVTDPDGFIKTLNEPVAQFVDHAAFQVPILGDQVQLPVTRIYHPTVAVQNAGDVIARISSGETVGLNVEFAPTNGTGYRAFIPTRWEDPNTEPTPEPWGLIGISEDSVFDEAQ
jgi:hypothetical protein